MMKLCSFHRASLSIWCDLLQETTLHPQSVKILEERIANTAIRLSRRVWRLGWYYRCAKTFVTLGALFVPALTGLDSQRLPSDVIFWLIWTISLATSASNAFVSLFGIDRSYFSCSQQLAALETEAWSFLSSSGCYDGKTHQDNFTAFVEKCEVILSKTARKHAVGKEDKRTTHAPATDDGKSEVTSKDDVLLQLSSARRTGSRMETM
jgi:hypothetical protein